MSQATGKRTMPAGSLSEARHTHNKVLSSGR